LQEGAASPAVFLAQACAETHSLSQLELTKEDEIVLLHTETTDGGVCAREVAGLIVAHMVHTPRIIEIEGLQVTDAARFRRVGVQRLFQSIQGICDQVAGNTGHEVILNATGGFKSVVPYITLYGLLQSLKVVYIFEQSKALLYLPPAPIQYGNERISQAMGALAQLEKAGTMPRESFFQAIPGLAYHDRWWYEALLEEDEGGYVTLSAFGALLAGARASEQAQVFLSPTARRDFEASRGNVREQFAFMLERVRDPIWRQGKRHNFTGTDLTVYKPGNTSERLAAIVQGNRVYACELLQHDAYERVLPGKMAAQYRLSEFTPWALPTDIEPPPATEEDATRRLQQRCEQLDKDRRQAETYWSESENRTKAAESKAKELENSLCRSQRELALARYLETTLRSDSQRLATDLEACQAELAWAKLPWWSRLMGRASRRSVAP
jgi:putative CRISPR-associated protein (TIGR02619 family)